MSIHDLFGRCITPAIYHATRILPRAAGRLLTRAVVKAVPARRRRLTIVDVGCGTGRYLPGLLSAAHDASVLGIDVSSRMLGAASTRVRTSPRCHLALVDCRDRDRLPDHSADLALFHWMANVSPDWAGMTENVTKWVRPDGVVAWFDERGTLYDAIDGIVAVSSDERRWSDFGYAFWTTWLTALGANVDGGASLSRRRGLPLRNDRLEAALIAEGWTVRRGAAVGVHWEYDVDYRWLFDVVLRRRAFSNLWMIPDRRYNKALEALAAFLQRYDVAPVQRERLKFSCSPVITLRQRDELI